MTRNYINILCDIFRNKTHKKEVFFLFFMSILFLYGGLLRYQGLLGRELEYDEVWTYSHYVNQPISLIFSNLATPNNHPLYTLFIKIGIPIFKNPVFAIKAPAFIAGLALMLVIPIITFIFTRQHYLATLLSLAIVAFNGAFIHFSQTGRGYTLQTICIALFILQITVIIKFRGYRGHAMHHLTYKILSSGNPVHKKEGKSPWSRHGVSDIYQKTKLSDKDDYSVIF